MGQESTTTGHKPGTEPGKLHGEHQVQVSLLKALRDAVEEKRPSAEIDEILDQLADFSRVHFTAEQLLMRLYGYDDYAPHLEEHDRAMDKLDELRGRLASGDAAGARVCLETFTAWLTDHIHHTDSQLSQHLRNVS